MTERRSALGLTVGLLFWPAVAIGQSEADTSHATPTTGDAPDVSTETASLVSPDETPVTASAGDDRRSSEPMGRIDGGAIARWITLGSAAAVLLSGAVFFGVGQREFKSDDFAAGTPWVGEPQEEYDEGRDKMVAGIVLMAIGGLASVAALVWVLSYDDAEPGASGEVAVRVGPGELSVSGRF